MVVKRVEPLPVGKVAAILSAARGLFVGVIVSCAAMIDGFAGRSDFGALAGGLVGIGATIALPVLYGVLGLIVAVIATWLYNLAAGFVGRIQIDVRPTAPQAIVLGRSCTSTCGRGLTARRSHRRISAPEAPRCPGHEPLLKAYL